MISYLRRVRVYLYVYTYLRRSIANYYLRVFFLVFFFVRSRGPPLEEWIPEKRN